MNAHPHLRNIQVYTFENETAEYTLAQDFQDFLVNQFQRDGRLRITTIEPDSFIEGSVLDYRHEIFTYDMAGNISEYRVSILFHVKMTDLRMQTLLYENRAMLISETYSPDNPNPDVLATEGQAIEQIFERAFDNIMRNTLSAW
jgi:hypothetical protein